MAKFRVLDTCFIGDQLRKAGDIVDVEFEKGANIGDHLEPIKPVRAKKGEGEGDAPPGDGEGEDMV